EGTDRGLVPLRELRTRVAQRARLEHPSWSPTWVTPVDRARRAATSHPTPLATRTATLVSARLAGEPTETPKPRRYERP
ncbi:MAG TPA: hypothetical protein VFQ35_03985, partial [Polyangiaceae bacterium]|nr:hypothetical protein [Polyangiaceae bacterium]